MWRFSKLVIKIISGSHFHGQIITCIYLWGKPTCWVVAKFLPTCFCQEFLFLSYFILVINIFIWFDRWLVTMPIGEQWKNVDNFSLVGMCLLTICNPIVFIVFGIPNDESSAAVPNNYSIRIVIYCDWVCNIYCVMYSTNDKDVIYCLQIRVNCKAPCK